MKIEVGQERSDIDVNISEIVKEGGQLNILPQVKTYFSIDYKPKSNKLTLAAKGFVGLIPVTTDLAIDIRPKFSIKNLARLVSIAQGKFQPISYFSKYYDEKKDPPEVVSEFLLDSFIVELEKLQTEGVYREYILRRENSECIRGKLKVSESIKNLWVHGHLNKATVEFSELSPETPFNKLIKFTIEYCLTQIHSQLVSNEIREKLNYFYQSFSAVTILPGENFLEDSFEIIKNEKVPELRSYYVNICEICRLLITGSGIDFDKQGNLLNISSFIINMEIIFESFLLNSLRNNRNIFGDEFRILDGNTKEGSKRFFTPPGTGKGDAKPDIILKNGGETKVIADAKYKVKSKDSDRYQVISHALSYDSNVAILIMPTNSGNTRIVKLGNVGESFPVQVYEIFINISSDDLKEEEKKLALILKELL